MYETTDETPRLYQRQAAKNYLRFPGWPWKHKTGVISGCCNEINKMKSNSGGDTNLCAHCLTCSKRRSDWQDLLARKSSKILSTNHCLDNTKNIFLFYQCTSSLNNTEKRTRHLFGYSRTNLSSSFSSLIRNLNSGIKTSKSGEFINNEIEPV